MASSICSCLAGLFRPTEGASSKEGGGIEMDRGGGSSSRAPRLRYELRPKGPDVVVTRPSLSASAAATGPLIKGRGVALVSIPVEQDACYFELHVRKAGSFTVGVSRAMPAASAAADDNNKGALAEGPLAWGLEVEPAQLALAPEAEAETSVEVVPDSEIPVRAKAGDVIGLVFSQSSFPMLAFTLNGRALPRKAVERVRGLVYPAVHLKTKAGKREGAGNDDGGGSSSSSSSSDEGPCVGFAFHEEEWAYRPPSSRFQMLLESRDMI